MISSSASFPYRLNHLPPGKFSRSDPAFKEFVVLERT